MCGCAKRRTSTNVFQGVTPTTYSVVQTTSVQQVNVVFAPEMVNSVIQVRPYLAHLVPEGWLTTTRYMIIKAQTITMDSRLVDYLNSVGVETSWS